MTPDAPMTHAPQVEPRTRDLASGLVVVVGGLALAGMVAGALLLPGITCGCATPPALVVTNRSDRVVHVEWRGTGFAGSSGSATVAACGVASPPELDPDSRYAVAVASGSTRWSGEILAPTSSDAEPGLHLVVFQDGRIETAYGGASYQGSPCPTPQPGE